MKILARMALALVALVLIYVALLVAVYAIPNSWIQENVNSALGVLDAEGAYPHYFFDYPYGQADNNTDKEMYKNLIKDSGTNALQAAMVPNYTRYWHGYSVALRPMSAFLSITNIRYINMVVMMLLLCLSFRKISRHLNTAAAISFLLGLVAIFCWLSPFNMQYFTVTALTLIFSLVVLPERQREYLRNIPVLFLCFGSLTNFFDYLTFPILTLGYPLILLLMMRKKECARHTFASEMLFLLVCSTSWLAGYGFTLLTKGVVGTLVTETNVLLEIFENALIRVNGTLPDGYSADASVWMAIRYNATAFFNNRNLCLMAGGLLCLAAGAHRRKISLRGWTALLPMLGAALFPYVWYAVLENHSIVHCYFTFKAQAVTVFGVSAFLISLADFSGKTGKAAARIRI